MNSDSDDLFYLKDTRTGKFHSPVGLVSDKEKASKFTVSQLKRRMKVAATHTKVFKEKLLNSFLAMEPVDEVLDQFLYINSSIEYEPEDMLDCDVEYHYKKNFIKGRTVYSEARNYLEGNKKNKAGLLKIVLNVRGIVGKINAD